VKFASIDILEQFIQLRYVAPQTRWTKSQYYWTVSSWI